MDNNMVDSGRGPNRSYLEDNIQRHIRIFQKRVIIKII